MASAIEFLIIFNLNEAKFKQLNVAGGYSIGHHSSKIYVPFDGSPMSTSPQILTCLNKHDPLNSLLGKRCQGFIFCL